MIEVHILHFILGVILFFIINWIGKHSYSVGYMEISMFLKVEEAPAFNFLFRIISPIVYLFVVSAILYKIGLDKYVLNAYFISIYYIVFRLVFNLFTNRGLLMNWYRQTLYWISIVSISYFAYTEIIYKKENILPDFETISNELWIIILIFIFHTLNQIRISSDNTIKRKENYLRNRLNHFRSKYSTLVNEKIENDKLKQIAYAIMIYEDFNRPKVARFIENLKFKVTGKKHSLGLMQVQTKKFINDYKSVELGLKKLNKSYKKALKKVLKEREMEEGEEHQKQFYRDQIAYMNEITIQNEIISKYNGGHSYNNEVSRLVELISEKKLIKIQSYLYPNYSGRRITYPYGEAEYEEE